MKTLTKTETKVLTKVDGYANFPKGTTWGQKIYFYDGAVGNLNENNSRLLVAFVGGNYGGWFRVDVRSDFWVGDRARPVLQAKNGELSLAKETVGSVEEAEKVAKKYEGEGKQLADASMLLNTVFIEQYPREILVFSSKNPSSLSEEKLKAGYYLAGAGAAETSQRAGSATVAVDLELNKVLKRRATIKETTEQLAKEDGQLADREKKLEDLKSKAEQADKERVQGQELSKSAEDKAKSILEEMRRNA